MTIATPRRRLAWKRWRGLGQGLVEYAMILALIAIVILGILTYLGQYVFTGMYSKISSALPMH